MSVKEDSGTLKVKVKFVKIDEDHHEAKATIWFITDAEVRKHGEQKGLDTLVVRAVNDECSLLDNFFF